MCAIAKMKGKEDFSPSKLEGETQPRRQCGKKEKISGEGKEKLQKIKYKSTHAKGRN